MTDSDLLVRLDRIALLLAALVSVELLELFDVGLSGFGFGLLAAAVLGFAFLWGRSVVGLFRGDGV